MEKMTSGAAMTQLRNDWFYKLYDWFVESLGEEALVVASAKIAIPAVDANGDERFVTFTISVPKGSHDGDAYDGYAEAESYRMGQEEKREKAAAREKEKAARIAKQKERKAAKEAKGKEEA